MTANRSPAPPRGAATRAVLYAAKSTQDKHRPIPTQLADCREMAEREGWTSWPSPTTRASLRLAETVVQD
jgi:hypothetical protein